MKITKAQLGRLQTCCSQMAKRVLDYTNTREERTAWASQVLGCKVESFSNLTIDQGRILIDAAQGEIGHRAAQKAPTPHRLRSTDAARREGLDGRHDGAEFANTPQLVSPDDLETIAGYYTRLGWDKARFDAFIASKQSPLRGSKAIRTKAQANKVRWALKSMLQDAGLWVDFKEVA